MQCSLGTGKTTAGVIMQTQHKDAGQTSALSFSCLKCSTQEEIHRRQTPGRKWSRGRCGASASG